MINKQGNWTNLSPGTVYDNAGNSTVCPANQTVRIDKTAPTCTSSGGSTAWTNNSRTLVGTCSDAGGSGCRGNASWLINWQGNWANLSPGTVYDNAGNSTVCPANQTVRICTNQTCTRSVAYTTTCTRSVAYTTTCTRNVASTCTRYTYSGNYSNVKCGSGGTKVAVSKCGGNYAVCCRYTKSYSCTKTETYSCTKYRDEQYSCTKYRNEQYTCCK